MKEILKKAGIAAVWIEGAIFPLLYLLTIINHIQYLWSNADKMPAVLNQLSTDPLNAQVTLFFSAFVAKILLIVLNALIIMGYVLRKKNLRHAPEGFKEIFVPLISGFFYLTFNFAQYLPAEINFLLIPQEYLLFSMIFGIILNIIGAVISSIATYNFRHSYSFFVQVRDIQTTGLYRFVRHPIYCGYTFAAVGFAFITPRFGYAMIFLISILLTIYRARLEERKLLKHSSEYRDYAAKVPFLFPFKLS